MSGAGRTGRQSCSARFRPIPLVASISAEVQRNAWQWTLIAYF